MPAPSPDSVPPRRAANPARVLLDSPLAAATRGRVYHLRRHAPPPSRGRRALAFLGTLLVHLLCLFAFVLGPAYEPTVLPDHSREPLLQVRLIEPPEPPPPPPVHGTPPKQRGPRQQGRQHPAPRVEPSANAVALTAAATPAKPAKAAPVAAPQPPVSLPAPTPLPLPKPAAPAVPAPPLALTLPAPVAPALPAPQPEPQRPPQAEGNRPILPPSALALPQASVPAVAAPPAITLQVAAPTTLAPLSEAPEPAPAPPQLPRPQPQTLAPLTPIAPPAPRLVPQLTQPAQLAEAVPAEVVAPPRALAPTQLDLQRSAPAPAMTPATLRPVLQAPTAVAAITPAPAASALPLPATAEVSRAPEASPQGSDTATVGEPAGATSVAPPSAPAPAVRAAASTGSQHAPSLAAGKLGGDRPGAAQGGEHGAVGDYVQLKPSGDTEIMRHRTPDVGYRPTRFEQDWTPEDESSVDTALRRAVEKTTVKHTFHLPRGVRVECAVKPLLPIALFGCRNPDPPPAPVAASAYAPLHLAPAAPLAPPAAASTPAPATSAPMVKFDNAAECAAARVAGGPLPPGCASELPPATPVRLPAPASSSWVPASDQFH